MEFETIAENVTKHIDNDTSEHKMVSLETLEFFCHVKSLLVNLQSQKLLFWKFYLDRGSEFNFAIFQGRNLPKTKIKTL